MKKTLLILFSVYLSGIFSLEIYGKREEYYDSESLKYEIEAFAKDDPKKQPSFYARYIWGSFNQMNFNESIKMIDALTEKFPDNENIDDFQWLKEIGRAHV